MSDPVTTLPVLQAGGFTASVDAFAWEPGPEPDAWRMRLWFLSLLGSRETVRAFWARLIKGETATMSRDHLGRARFCALEADGPRRWRFVSVGLQTVAGYHGVLVPETARYTAEGLDFLLLPRTAAEAPVLHYRFLNRRLDLPLHAAWADWLWERARRTGEAVTLESHGVQAYRCMPQADVLAADLSTAVRGGALGLVGGSDGDAVAATAPEERAE